MIERVIENWLTKSTERSYQVPFSYMLSKEGHTIVHISRHCGMELGKDILTIAPDGIPCAYQLKTGDISLSRWKTEIVHQVQDLVLGSIVHPSIPDGTNHRSYLVTNGKLEEEVSRAVDDLNSRWRSKGQPELNVIVGGILFQKAKKLENNLWPSELSDVKLFLELFLENGKDVFPKAKLAKLLESTLPFEAIGSKKRPSQALFNRYLSSAAVLCSIALSSFSNERNYAAEADAWALYIAYTLAVAEKWNLPEKLFKQEIDIAFNIIKNSLANLVTEIMTREHLGEGDLIVDQPFFKIRMTWLLALVSIHGLWMRYEQQLDPEIENFHREFCAKNIHHLDLWGEAAIPQILAFHWFFRKINATPAPDFILRDLILAISKRNARGSGAALPSPYHEAIDILPYIIDSQLDKVLPHRYRLAKEPFDEDFSGQSFYLEGLVHLFVRRNWKQAMKLLWSDISKIANSKFVFEKQWHFYRWRNSHGKNKTEIPQSTKKWDDLKRQANESEGENIPKYIKKYPIFVLLFICVYPHRASADLLRWLDAEIQKFA